MKTKTRVLSAGLMCVVLVCVAYAVLNNNIPLFHMAWEAHAEAIYNNGISWLAIQQWNATSSAYVTMANWTSTGQSVRVRNGWVTRILCEVKLNSTLAGSVSDANSFTKVNCTIDGDWAWTSINFNASTYKTTYLSGSYYYVVKQGVRNSTGIPTAGTTYNGKVTYQAYY